ncbi:hypothetical protein KAT36_03210 [Candidatus Pacearchaeota archaeon]|nr:hypothetical protein [Candidatus Pacearchaeota archaeon]
MPKLFNKEEKAPTEYPVFNLEVTRDKSTPFLRKHDRTSRYIGEFIVYNSGQLKRGIDTTLHTYETKIEYCDNCIHFPSGRVIDSITKDSKPFLEAKFETPCFTLDGFYSIVCPEVSEKSKSLTEYIKQFNPKFQFNSIATHENTRLKLLENAYKRYVSNQ